MEYLALQYRYFRIKTYTHLQLPGYAAKLFKLLNVFKHFGHVKHTPKIDGILI